MPKDKMTITYAPLVINTGGKLVVVDTGNGAAAFASSKGNVGQFTPRTCRRPGFDPKAGRYRGDLAFPRRSHQRSAECRQYSLHFRMPRCLVPAAEWKYFMDDGEMSRASGERMQSVFKNARRVLEAGLKKKVTPYESGKDVAPGLLALDTDQAIRRATRPTCCRPARKKSSSSRTSPTIRLCSPPIPAGT